MKNEAYDQDLFLREMEETLGFIEAKSGMINKNAIKFRKLIAKAKTDLESGVLSGSEYSDFKEEYESNYATIIRTTSNLLYKLQPSIFNKKRSIAGQISELESLKFWEDEIGVTADFIDESLIISMPILPQKAKATVARCDAISHPFQVTHMHYYDRIITAQAYKLEAEIVDKMFDWHIKTINIFHVYDEDSKHIPDTDNHDCKKAIDAVCSLFRTGDSAVTTSLSMHTFTSKTVPVGSYFIVTQGRKTIEFDRAIELISSFLDERNVENRKQKTSDFIKSKKEKLLKTELENKDFINNNSTEKRMVLSVKKQQNFSKSDPVLVEKYEKKQNILTVKDKKPKEETGKFCNEK